MNDKYALCVGINDYPGSDADLFGCNNDAADWGALLAERGFEVEYLIDSQATKRAIVEALARNAARVGYRDKFVFTYSGHGTWVPDRDGDEVDHRDEALVCYDYLTGGLLVDDELQNLLQMQHGSQTTIISDSCHSGTMARFVPEGPPVQGRRFLSPSVFIEGLSEERAAQIEQSTHARALSRTGPVLISGCNDLEYSYDAIFSGRPNGAMSRVAIDEFKDGIKVGAWFRAIREHLPNEMYPQTPQLTATATQKKRTAL